MTPRRAASLKRLAELADARAAIDADIARMVRVLRERDESWQAIGEALGLSRQGAQQRYGDVR